MTELETLTAERDDALLECEKLRQFVAELVEDAEELRGERDWWKNEPRRGRQKDYEDLCARIWRARSALNPMNPYSRKRTEIVITYP